MNGKFRPHRHNDAMCGCGGTFEVAVERLAHACRYCKVGTLTTIRIAWYTFTWFHPKGRFPTKYREVLQRSDVPVVDDN